MTTHHGLDLAEQARVIVDRLRAHGFARESAVNRQVLALAEEAGEFVGAYRRWSGQARRAGTAEDLHAELADVVITAYVTAAELDIDLDAAVEVARCYGCWLPGPGVEVERWVLKVSTSVAGFVRAFFREDQPFAEVARKVELSWVVCTAYAAASALDIDLDAAISAKLAVVFTRGWREPLTGADRPTLAQTRTGLDWCAGCGVEAGTNRYGGAAGHPCCGTCGARLSVGPAAADTVPCGLGCGYLAGSEADLDRHENHECDNRFAPLPAERVSVPSPRPVGSIPRRVARPRQRSGGEHR